MDWTSTKGLHLYLVGWDPALRVWGTKHTSYCVLISVKETTQPGFSPPGIEGAVRGWTWPVEREGLAFMLSGRGVILVPAAT